MPDVQFICTEEAQKKRSGEKYTVRVHHNTSLLKVSSGVALIEFVLKVDGDCTF